MEKNKSRKIYSEKSKSKHQKKFPLKKTNKNQEPNNNIIEEKNKKNEKDNKKEETQKTLKTSKEIPIQKTKKTKTKKTKVSLFFQILIIAITVTLVLVSFALFYKTENPFELNLFQNSFPNPFQNIFQKTIVLDLREQNQTYDYYIEAYEDQLIKLKVFATDPDNDPLRILYSYPLNSTGEWKTDYFDAGIYDTEVKVTDGELEDLIKARIKINDVDRRPSMMLEQRIYSLYEGQQIIIPINAIDLDNDPVEISIKNNSKINKLTDSGELRLENEILYFNPSYDFVYKNTMYKLIQAIGIPLKQFKILSVDILARSEHNLENRTDNENQTIEKTYSETKERIWFIVFDKNKEPIIGENEPIYAKELDLIEITPNVTDPDNDKLFFKYEGWINQPKYQTKISDAGEHDVIVTVSDGEYEKEYVQKIYIEKNNLAPEIKNLKDFKIKENQVFDYLLQADDPNNDSFEIDIIKSPEGLEIILKDSNHYLRYQPDFNTSSSLNNTIHRVIIRINDSVLSKEYSFNIEVLNVNRKPIIENYTPDLYISAEKDTEIKFKVDAFDLDFEDKNNLTYIWNIPVMRRIKTNNNEITVVFTSPGRKNVRLKVCDQKNCTALKWQVNVYSKYTVD